MDGLSILIGIIVGAVLVLVGGKVGRKDIEVIDLGGQKKVVVNKPRYNAGDLLDPITPAEQRRHRRQEKEVNPNA